MPLPVRLMGPIFEMPVPAGGMTPERVPEMLDFYGADIMLLIGGGLLAARERLTEETAAFVAAVPVFSALASAVNVDAPSGVAKWT